MPSNRYITRLKHHDGREYGWWVRIWTRGSEVHTAGGKPWFQESVLDSEHGGSEAALVYARQLRNDALSSIGIKKVLGPGMRFHREVGFAGVGAQIVLRPSKSGVRVKAGWYYMIPAPGQCNDQSRRSICMRQYGYQGGFIRAVKLRCDAYGYRHPDSVVLPAPAADKRKLLSQVEIESPKENLVITL